ncbi:hypothetical protein [Methylobacterium bullatum]|uniref:Uncharacterized protein n=1 Tax=Methylobacterium bullatum TaxID=570505 RepID=A0A679JQP6_9HYPH|nr:hypothetical protein MBLL_01935 [Methylobacterium bullatum]
MQLILKLRSPIQTLDGLAFYWTKTNEWCGRQRAKGKPFRRLKLPDPGRMSQIGHSINFVFPSRHDLGRMEKLFGNMASRPSLLASDVVASVRPELLGHPWSQGFQKAFEDFDTRRRKGEKLLADHPFWIGIVGLRTRELSKDKRDPIFEIEFSTDFDGQSAFSIRTDVPEILRKLGINLPHESSTQVASVSVSLFQALDAFSGSANAVMASLVRCHSEGIIPFCEEQWGTWRATRALTGARTRLLVRNDILRRRSYPISDPTAGWSLLQPLPPAEAEVILVTVRPPSAPQSDISQVRFSEGIKIDRAYLGRPGYLPKIMAVEGCRASLIPFGQVSGNLALAVVGSSIVLSSDGALDGVWRIPIDEKGSTRSEPTIIFEPEARELDLEEPDILAKGWRPDEPEIASCEPYDVSLAAWEGDAPETSQALLDLLEALYAGGRRGWSEQDMVRMVKSCLPIKFAGWDALQMLTDSGWMEPWVSRSWKARKWYLIPPYLVEYRREGAVLLDGAVPQRMRRRFASVATSMGAVVETRSTPGSWAIPSLIAYVPDAAAFASRMNLTLKPALTQVPASNTKLHFKPTLFTDEKRSVGSTWNWDRKSFIKIGQSSFNGVKLERLETAKPSASDIYRISIDEKVKYLLDGRSASILMAHRLSGVPQYEFKSIDKSIKRLSASGALPFQIARFLRLRNGCGPSLIFGLGNTWTYQMHCGPEDADVISVWLGNTMIDDRVNGSDEPDFLRSIVMSRARGRAGFHVANQRWKDTTKC